MLLRSSDKAAIVIDPVDPLVAKHLARPGRWSRLEGTLWGDQLTLNLNGHELFKGKPYPGVPAGGPIRIVPTGPIDFASIYVRELKGAGREP